MWCDITAERVQDVYKIRLVAYFLMTEKWFSCSIFKERAREHTASFSRKREWSRDNDFRVRKISSVVKIRSPPRINIVYFGIVFSYSIFFLYWRSGDRLDVQKERRRNRRHGERKRKAVPKEKRRDECARERAACRVRISKGGEKWRRRGG